MLPAKTQYACLAMLELALQGANGKPVALREITQRHGIPQPFLVQILQQLKIAGLVLSTRGSQGGYQLPRSPESIRLLEVVEAVGSDISCGPTLSDSTRAGRALGGVWSELAERQRQILDQMTLGDLVRQCGSAAEPMFYI